MTDPGIFTVSKIITNPSIALFIYKNWYAPVILFVRFGHVHVVQTFETIINCVRYIIEINCAQVYIVFFITQGNVKLILV